MLLNQIIPNALDIEITNIEIDSRKINQNGLFFALLGIAATHGREFIDQAIKTIALN